MRTKQTNSVDHHIIYVIQSKSLDRGIVALPAHQVHPNLHHDDSNSTTCGRQMVTQAMSAKCSVGCQPTGDVRTKDRKL